MRRAERVARRGARARCRCAARSRAMVSIERPRRPAAARARRRRGARARPPHAAWLDTPHVPHGWECGFLIETTTGRSSAATCSRSPAPATRRSPSRHPRAERGDPPRDGLLLARAAHAGDLERLAADEAATLACMHGARGGRRRRSFLALADALGAWPRRLDVQRARPHASVAARAAITSASPNPPMMCHIAIMPMSSCSRMWQWHIVIPS